MQLAVLGDVRAVLPPDWNEETAVTILGDVRIDSSAGVGSNARLTFIGVAGDLLLRVPAGSRVRTDGLLLFGDTAIEVTPGEGPELTVSGFGLFGDLRITDRLI